MLQIDKSITSPNSSPRNGASVTHIVLHHTGGTRKSDIPTLIDTSRPLKDRVSAHYYVQRDAKIYQLVDESLSAWHAGIATVSNENSIGIEMENLGGCRQDWPRVQVEAAAELCADILSRHNLPGSSITTHAAIALPRGRKADPECFPFGVFLHSIAFTFLWGNDYPLPPEERYFGIPTAYLYEFTHNAKLGRAIGFSYYKNNPPVAGVPRQTLVVQFFAGGMIFGEVPRGPFRVAYTNKEK